MPREPAAPVPPGAALPAPADPPLGGGAPALPDPRRAEPGGRPLPAARPPAAAPAPYPPAYWAVPPETSRETTVRLRPVPAPRRSARTAAAVACLVLGIGLVAGSAAGTWVLRDPGGAPGRTPYTEAAALWHSVPVDSLFPRVLEGADAGPGGADRSWTRVAVAPDAPCAAVLRPRLAAALAPAGCLRVLRATYTDATSSSVTTVGLVFTEGDAAGMTALRARFTDGGLDRSPDLIPPAFAAPGTVAAGFGDAQRASWHVNVLTEVPVVVYGVSGFADGRPVPRPEPARQATAEGRTTAPAQAGLGHEARGLADRTERALRAAVAGAVGGPAGKGER
ncbi:hypothetical protein LUW75_20680 [Streptomyces sp. MRC013]|uniref:hypothetical protein n=1 Tax=Streptomyces sp. MRC013 TaxID=2898276 RepID=UPI0020262F6C|nr:hypothetical protein [Streptomyces sp. MRC013]URM91977.1 hypothetical protein LUW75_20680 [Streptomyces sp. MRC013]